jgi:hypothetical protein
VRKKIIQSIVTLIVGVGLFPAINSLTNEFLSSPNAGDYTSAIKSLVSIMPLMFAIIVILGIFAGLGKDSEVEIAAQIDWTRYGERLKLAYSAKFGGDNPGFNEEVDNHIKILVNTDKGFARQLAKDWVERMSKFVGIHWLRMENSNEVA